MCLITDKQATYRRHIGEPHDHKSGGLEPLDPIGVYVYGVFKPTEQYVMSTAATERGHA